MAAMTATRFSHHCSMQTDSHDDDDDDINRLGSFHCSCSRYSRHSSCSGIEIFVNNPGRSLASEHFWSGRPTHEHWGQCIAIGGCHLPSGCHWPAAAAQPNTLPAGPTVPHTLAHTGAATASQSAVRVRRLHGSSAEKVPAKRAWGSRNGGCQSLFCGEAWGWGLSSRGIGSGHAGSSVMRTGWRRGLAGSCRTIASKFWPSHCVFFRQIFPPHELSARPVGSCKLLYFILFQKTSTKQGLALAAMEPPVSSPFPPPPSHRPFFLSTAFWRRQAPCPPTLPAPLTPPPPLSWPPSAVVVLSIDGRPLLGSMVAASQASPLFQREPHPVYTTWIQQQCSARQPALEPPDVGSRCSVVQCSSVGSSEANQASVKSHDCNRTTARPPLVPHALRAGARDKWVDNLGRIRPP